MSLTRTLVDNRHTVWALAIAAAVFGTLAYVSLPMQLFPDTSPPVVNVITAYPGASAEDVADDLSRPLEEEIASVEGVVTVGSSSQDNLSMTSVEFQYDRDVDLAAVDVQNAISRIRGELPDGIREPQVLTLSTGDRPVITVGVGAEELSLARTKAEEVFAPRLQRVDGVAGIDVFGGAEEAVLVELDPRRLEAHRVPMMRVVRALRTHDMAGPAGRLRTERTDTSFRVEARARNLDALAAIPLTMPDGTRVRLGDLGEIRRGTLDDQARFAVDGRRLVAMQLFKAEEANTVDVVGRLEGVVDELAVIAGVGTTIIVLSPLLFITGFVGKTFGPLAKTLIAAFSSSVLVALVLVPVLSIYTGGESRADRLAERITGPFRAVMSRIKAFYLGLLERALNARVVTDVEEAVAGVELPDGYGAEVTGERSDLEEAKSQLGLAFGVALLAVYLLLVAQLRSFAHPLTVIGSVPLSLIGVGTALWLADKPVSMPVMIGLILLVGTVVNNAILLIDFIRQAREGGESCREAIVGSVAVRFRPIMMTSMSTIVGMIPLAAEWALGAERFSPLAIAVIGGLTAATFLTMVVIPVLYDSFDQIGEWLGGLAGGASMSSAGVVLTGVAAVGLTVGIASPAVAQQTRSLTVEEAVERAHQESWGLEAREAEEESAELRQKRARRRFLPRFDLRGRAELALASRLGMPASVEIELVDTLSSAAAKRPSGEAAKRPSGEAYGKTASGKTASGKSAEEWVGRAVEGRPEVGVAREAYQLKQRRARAARAEMWPSLSLQAGYTLASPHDRYFPPREEVNGSWDVSLVLSWRVWDWGATELEGRAADGEARAARARLRRVERATRLEVRQLAADVRAAEARVDSARRAVASARQALAMSRSMFEAGRVTTTEVLDSELQLAEARSGVVEARVDRRLALARLIRVVGQPSSGVGHRSSGAPKR